MKVIKSKYALFGLLIILIAITFTLYYRYFPGGMDWIKVYRPVTLLMLKGESPYGYLGTDPGFFNPPWTLLPFIPIALIPEKAGNALIFLIALTSYFILLRKLKVKLLPSLLFMFSLPVIADLVGGNIAWLTMLGYIMPPQIGLFFVLMKPQIGGIVAFYWLVEAWRVGGLKQVIKIFLPVTIAFALSFLIYGFWITKLPSIIGVGVNVNIFPISLPLGLVMLSLSLRRHEIKFAYIASPFFSPYAGIASYGTTILGLTDSIWETFAITAGFWIAFIISLLKNSN